MVTLGPPFWRDELDGIVRGRPGWRVSGSVARGPCPCCGSRTAAWALRAPSGGVAAGCWSCSDRDGVRHALGLTARSAQPPRHRPPPAHRADAAPDMVAEADQLDAVYRVMLRHLEMGTEERRSKLGRDRSIQEGLRSRIAPLLGALPRGAAWERVRSAIVAELRAAAPDEFLRRVPELAVREGGTYAVLPYREDARYFEPWRDELGRIVAIRSYFGRRPGVDPYRTTKGRWGPLVHVAVGCARERMADAPWLLTEGWMKAEVAAHALGCVAVAFPGVSAKSSWDRALEIKQRLAPESPTHLAFDAEIWTTRLDLTVSVLELAARLRCATGRLPGYAVWNATVPRDGKVTPKGIDDAIVAGEPVHLVDRHEFAGLLGPVLEEWERVDAA